MLQRNALIPALDGMCILSLSKNPSLNSLVGLRFGLGSDSLFTAVSAVFMNSSVQLGSSWGGFSLK